MSKLDEHTAFIRLILRSDDHGDGWRIIAEQLEFIISRRVARGPELFEVKREPIGGRDTLMIRLSERGRIIAEYL